MIRNEKAEKFGRRLGMLLVIAFIIISLTTDWIDYSWLSWPAIFNFVAQSFFWIIVAAIVLTVICIVAPFIFAILLIGLGLGLLLLIIKMAI